MELPTYFADFLKDIRPTLNQREEMKTGHTTLRDRLRAHDSLNEIYVSDFLQGSYRRSTAVRPKDGNRSDVDVVVVTNMSEAEYTPQQAMDKFVPFLNDHYKDKWKFQGRSIGIELSYVDLDLVVTSAPSEAEVEKLTSKSVRYSGDIEAEPDWVLSEFWLPRSERNVYMDEAVRKGTLNPWKLDPLRIPDREAEEWDDTHPLEQLSFTVGKNKACNGHFVNIVKALKWWKRVNSDLPKYPKGYPIEHLIGDCCPDSCPSVASGVTETLEEIERKYKEYADSKTVPFLSDHGVPLHNVFHRITGEDFQAFHAEVEKAADTARNALDEQDKQKSVALWRKLFGTKFPEARSGGESGGSGGSSGDTKSDGYTDRTRQGSIGEGSFA